MMTLSPGATQAIAAIRQVRTAAHELANVCSAIVGGTEMAISLPTADHLGDAVPNDMGEISDEQDRRATD